jgi:hypothetical protein
VAIKSFILFLREQAEQSKIIHAMKAQGHPHPLSVGDYQIEFILPDGVAVELDHTKVHAQAVYDAGKIEDVKMQLVDVLQAGVVRAASSNQFQVGGRISPEQAQTMFDRAQTRHYDDLTVSVASTEYAHRDYDWNEGVGPITIDDKDYKTFDLSRVSPDGIRAWVNAHVN